MKKNWNNFLGDKQAQQRLIQRSEIIFSIRNFFRERGFLSVETPTIVAYPGLEPNLDPFVTEVIRNDGAKFPAYLITSPEYACKKLLAAGHERIFEITRCYRNGEPWGDRHNHEFTMIEWYRAQADYRIIMEDTEQLVQTLAEQLFNSTVIEYQGQKLDLTVPWPRLTVAEAFEHYADIDLLSLLGDVEKFRVVAEQKNCVVTNDDSFEDLFFKIFLRDIEPNLGQGQPVFLSEYPREMAALSRLKPDDSRLAERFEVYACGLELANAFSELTDSIEQRRRLEQEQVERARLGKIVTAIDEDFIEAVSQMPAAAGIALGVDRLVMLLTNAPTIQDILFFPAADLFITDNHV
ncbi:EF-P lysine aminoacylase GenX [Patescibacteria group bacterium]|nr:EF-P lysine aminoacylase GenX [Patescibacteria group bacterium]MBU1915656.1 EF-P lysine aminoacylase GenX [Patescibacteria group bacterium]